MLSNWRYVDPIGKEHSRSCLPSLLFKMHRYDINKKKQIPPVNPMEYISIPEHE